MQSCCCCWPGRSAGDQLGAELLLLAILLLAILLLAILLLASAVHSDARPPRTVQMRR
jgi:hypothetical protein